MNRVLACAMAAAAVVLASCGSVRPGAGASEGPGVAAGVLEEHMATGFLFETVTVGGVERRYAVYVPREYTPETKWPVLVFLNGSGECGTDGQKQLAVGLGPAVMFNASSWPFIMVFPQKPDQPSLWGAHDELVLAELRETMEKYSADSERVYLTGLSQGGRGTWEIGAKHADVFAAIVPICGWGDPATMAPALKDMPVWAFHGEKDDVVKPRGTREMVEAIEKLGGTPKMTIFPDANHNSWDRAYRTEGLPGWLLEQRRR